MSKENLLIVDRDSKNNPYLRIDHKTRLEPAADYLDPGLTVKPPDIVRYFVRVKGEDLSVFAEKNALEDLPNRKVEDEFIYWNTFRLNQKFYASLGEKRAFVLSHARNLMIFKIVGYAGQVRIQLCCGPRSLQGGCKKDVADAPGKASRIWS